MLLKCPTCYFNYDTKYAKCPHCNKDKDIPIPQVQDRSIFEADDKAFVEKVCSPVEEKQVKLDNMYMDICERIAQMSYAVRRKVGAIAVKDENILAFGWNGTPSGFDNCCEDENNVSKDDVIHAEINLFSKLASTTGNSKGATIYLTLSPCNTCSKLIIQAGIKRVVFGETYRISEPIEMLKKAGIEVVKLPR